MYNENFKVVEFDHFKQEAGLHTLYELTVLSNLETHNAEMIKQGIDKEARFKALKDIASYQLNVLNEAKNLKGDQTLLT